MRYMKTVLPVLLLFCLLLSARDLRNRQSSEDFVPTGDDYDYELPAQNDTGSADFAPSKPGHGLLPFSRNRVLTAEGKSKAYWRWNPVYAPENVIVGPARQNRSRDPKCIYYSGIWQELGLKESAAAAEWAKRVVLDE